MYVKTDWFLLRFFLNLSYILLYLYNAMQKLDTLSYNLKNWKQLGKLEMVLILALFRVQSFSF